MQNKTIEAPTALIYDKEHPMLIRRAATLRVASGEDSGVSCPIGPQPIRVGTAADNDLVLTDGHVSRHHVELRIHDRGYLIRDLGSTNGVFFRGARIQEAIIGPGAEVRVGSTALRLEVGAEQSGRVTARETFGGLVGVSPAMQDVYGLLAAVAPTDATVLLEGETGTGKEMVAEAIHRESPRRRASFCVLDCGAISKELIESEIFGHEKGAFTGAVREREGVFERARGGTVFLDEIGELPLELQTRLLRVLDRREVRRVGGNFTRRVDARMVAATNRNLALEVRERRFRQDLFYRLAVIRIVLPPLRQRREDIPELARHFLWQAGCADPDSVLTPELLGLLGSRQWSGNVRELRNAIERSVVLGDGAASISFAGQHSPQVASADAPSPVRAAAPATIVPPPVPADSHRAADDEDWLASALPAGYLERPYKEAKEELVRRLERLYLDRLLAEHGNNLSQLARAAGVDRQIIRRMLRRHELDDGR